MGEKMTFDIIKEQRLIRTLFYSLIEAANLVAESEKAKKQFKKKLDKYIRDRVMIDEDVREIKEVVTEFIETLGWRNITISYDTISDKGKITLGNNRYIPKELADAKGTLIVLEGLFQGLCFHLLKKPATTKATLSLKQHSNYELSFSKSKEEQEDLLKKPEILDITPEISYQDTLSMETIFFPIFGRNIPKQLLLNALWKVVSESYTSNYLQEGDTNAKEALKKETEENLSFLILKMIEDEPEEEIISLATILGEFIVKILSTQIEDSLLAKLQSTLQDRHATSYLIYYDRCKFCADKKYEGRCSFIHGLWLGILSEIYGIPIEIKSVLHAGKRDRYCMVELEPK
jgi:hypothetical protein